jgi:hypothetical protein
MDISDLVKDWGNRTGGGGGNPTIVEKVATAYYKIARCR